MSELTSASDTDYILTDACNLPAAMFPCRMRYMDLSALQMNFSMRIPEMILIRDEWAAITDVLASREDGINGSVLITGQPGMGKYQLIASSIRCPHQHCFSLKGKRVICTIFWSSASWPANRLCSRTQRVTSLSSEMQLNIAKGRLISLDQMFLRLWMLTAPTPCRTTFSSKPAIFE